MAESSPHSGDAESAEPATAGLVAIVLAVTIVRIATLVADPIALSVDEAQYWIWAQSPSFGYYSKPPMIAWLIAVTTTACGDGEACVRLAAPLLHGATTAALYAIAAALYGRTTAWWSAAAYLLLPGVSVSARIISTDVPLLLCWALALWCFVRALFTARRAWWVGLGAAVGFGLLSKYAMALFPACAALAALLSPEVRRRISGPGLAAAAAIAALIAAPNVVWNWVNGFPSITHAATNLSIAGAAIDPGRALGFLASQFAVFGPIMCGVLLFGGFLAFRRPTAMDWRDTILLAFSLPIIVAVTIEALMARAHANWAAPAFIAGTVYATRWMMNCRPILMQASFAIHLAAAATVAGAGPVLAAFEARLPAWLDPAVRERGWEQIGPWLADLHWRYPEAVFVFDNRQAMAAAIYYARPLLNDAAMWNSWGDLDNHFEMTTDPMRYVGRDLVYVNRTGSLDWVEGTYQRAMPLAPLTIMTHKNRSLELHAHLLTRFGGYRQ